MVLLNILERLDAAIQSIHCHCLVVQPFFQWNGFENPARYRIYAAERSMHFPRLQILRAIQRNAFPAQPIAYFIEHQHRVNFSAFRRLLLFGNARADKADLCFCAMRFTQQPRVRHRR